MQSKRPLGWRKDKYDGRDFIHYRLIPITLPDSVDLSANLPEVRDQGNIGSCVGFGVGANITATAKQQDVFSEWFSPNWIYNGARFIEGTLNEDAGAYPRDGFQWLVDKGGLLEHFWPYDGTQLDKTPPPAKFDTEADKYPVLAYYRVTGGADGICTALAAGHFVSIGTPWFDTWFDVGADGVLPAVNSFSDCVGGHETCLYGYDMTKGVFYGMNSWGPDWGRGGHYTMPMSAFSNFGAFGGYDAHYVVVAWESEPEPPEPEPPNPEPEPEPDPPSPPVSKFPLWIIAAVIALAALVLIIL
jgi:hypothetical protein